jgi:hypothetical protein
VIAADGQVIAEDALLVGAIIILYPVAPAVFVDTPPINIEG